MSAKEYNLWIADYSIEPWGEIRSDLRAATIVKSNIIPHTSKDIKLADCMLDFKPVIEQTPKQIYSSLKAFTLGMGGKVD